MPSPTSAQVFYGLLRRNAGSLLIFFKEDRTRNALHQVLSRNCGSLHLPQPHDSPLAVLGGEDDASIHGRCPFVVCPFEVVLSDIVSLGSRLRFRRVRLDDEPRLRRRKLPDAMDRYRRFDVGRLILLTLRAHRDPHGRIRVSAAVLARCALSCCSDSNERQRTTAAIARL